MVGEKLVMVVFDCIFVFDYVLFCFIFYKGQVLNQVVIYFLQVMADIVFNWLEVVFDFNVVVGVFCMLFKVEMVICGYFVGYVWWEYKLGKCVLCGVLMLEGMKESDWFLEFIIILVIKVEEGYDEDISWEEIIVQGIVSEVDYI